ncbi:MAG: YggS family pyridoxal phosphate-dependent enzyme [Longimicrobiales bacterium]
MDEARLRENLAQVEAQIEQARMRSGRRETVTIVAVTKGHPPDVVKAAQAVGLSRCGENRVDELDEKVAAVGREAVEWHLVGHLQRNKVRRALALFDLIHSIDSERLAAELAHEAQRSGTTVRGLIQVNVSGEETKGGFDARESFEPVMEQIRRVVALPALEVLGLMTMAPFDAEESTLRRIFRRSRELYDECGRAVTGFQARHLSMGMSGDYEVAVEEGSTMVRLGTILFGERHQ